MKKPKLSVKDSIKGRPIRLNKCVLKPQKPDYVEVMFVGDLHFGSPQCDHNRFLANLDYCLKHGIYVVLMGDLLETATRHSVGAGVYEQTHPAQSQYEQVIDWLEPLANADLILGALTGNHEERVYKETGVNLTKAMCRELKIKYLGDACWQTFKVGKQTYTIYSLHGRSGARFDGTALLALERISTSFFCDMVAMGHAHKCINSIVVSQRAVGGKVVEHKKHLLITGAYLSYDGGYGQVVGLPISKMGSPKVKFYTKKHDISVSW